MMDQVAEQKLAEFIDICSDHDLASEETKFLSAIDLLKDIYTDHFRHEYSKISRMLSRPERGVYTSDQFTCLRDNLSYIESVISSTDLSEPQKDSFRKLSDHIRLEAYRIENVDRRLDSIVRDLDIQKQTLDLLDKDGKNVQSLLHFAQRALLVAEQVKSQQGEQKKIFDEITEKIEQSRKKEKELSDNLEVAQEKIKNFDTQAVTILSIFSAIVFAFTGGFTMLGSAFGNLSGITRNESILLITLVLIVGCILVDIIYFLLHFIGRIAGIPVGGGCTLKCDDCSKKEPDKPTCDIWTRLNRRHPIIFCLNIIVMLVVVLLFVFNMAWVTPEFPMKNEPAEVVETTEACMEIPVTPNNQAQELIPTATVQPLPTASQPPNTADATATNTVDE